jgi:two-component system LytT family response regulator
MIMKCTVIDDEAFGADILIDHISKIPDLILVSTFLDPVLAFNHISKNTPDLLFLDIEMPCFSGLDFVEALNIKHMNKKPLVVFTTGHDEFALKSFEYGVSDYLLKPITFKRFKFAVDRILNQSPLPRAYETADTFFFAEAEGKKFKLNFSDVQYVEAAGNYVTIVTITKKFTIYGTMNAMQALLPENSFCRIHKSFIASISHIQAVSGNELIMLGHESHRNLPIGSKYKDALLKKLKIH